MAKSGARLRPVRLLVVAERLDGERLRHGLRPEGHIVEVASTCEAALERVEHPPAIDLVLVNGVSAFERARLLGAARDRGTWCLYLRGPGPVPELAPAVRAMFVAALQLDGDWAHLIESLRTIIAARRAGTAGGSGNSDPSRAGKSEPPRGKGRG